MLVSRGRDGQALILVAIAMFVLVGAVALAVDVGNLYAERRQMQNAADAGALAGARVLCAGGTETEAKAEAIHYAIDLNGAENADPVVGGKTVTVTTSIVANTFLAGVIGTNDADVGAVAVAACECADEACALWPIGFHKATWEAAVAGSCDQEVLLWTDDEVDCTMFDCSAFAAVPPDARTWIDFSAALPDGTEDPCDQPGCGNNELRDRIKGYEKNSGAPCLSWISLPACVPGDAGTKASSWKAVKEEVGEVKRVPLYDSMGCTMDPDPGNACTNIRYLITGFACIRVLREETVRFNPLPEPPGHKPPPNWPKQSRGFRVIVVEMVCEGEPGHEECFSGCGSVGGVGHDGCITAVSLKR